MNASNSAKHTPEHVHDYYICCECGSAEHCCCDCPAFGGPENPTEAQAIEMKSKLNRETVQSNAHMKHTPGPWHHDQIARHCIVSTQSPRKGICLMKNTSDEDWEANARLIAAAPELLEACRAFVAAYSGHDASLHHSTDPTAHSCSVCNARAAIAKASGEGAIVSTDTQRQRKACQYCGVSLSGAAGPSCGRPSLHDKDADDNTLPKRARDYDPNHPEFGKGRVTP